MEDLTKLTARIAALSPEQREVFLKRLKQKGSNGSSPAATIPHQSREANTFLLSPAQERLWFIHQVEPDTPLYNLPVALRIKGRLQVDALQQSLNEMIRRHESLRTTFANVDGRPLQVIGAPFAWPLHIVDLCTLSPDVRQTKAQELIQAEAQRPFDLAQGPLVRAVLLHVDAEEHLFLLTKHHMIADGWSFGVLHRELWALYDAAVTQTAANLPELPIQYVDFALWQRDQLESETMAAEAAYWQQQLAGKIPVLELPTDRPRPLMQTINGGRETSQLPPALYNDLKQVSKDEGVTLFMLLLAAFKTLLYRYTGQQDILVGSPIAGRDQSEVEGLIGFFVNTLVLRTGLAGNLTFRQLLQQVRQVALDAYRYPHIPFARLVELLQPERDPSHTPLFQVMFVLQDNPMKAYQLRDLTIEQLDNHTGTARFDLTLEIAEIGGRLQTAIDYNSDLFEATTIRRMLAQYETLLASITANIDRPLNQLNLLTAAEEQLLIEWNQTNQPFPADSPIHRLFEQQVERFGDTPAVTFAKEFDAIYAELNATSFNPAVVSTLNGIYGPMPSIERTASAASTEQHLTTFAGCCFRRNPFVHRFRREHLQNATDLSPTEVANLNLLATHAQLMVVASDNLLAILDCFDGRRNLQTVAGLVESPAEYLLGLVSTDKKSNKLKIEQEGFTVDNRSQSWIPLIKALHASSLIELVDYQPHATPAQPAEPALTIPLPLVSCNQESYNQEAEWLIHPPPVPPTPPDALSPVLLVGATTGAATVGIMYLASFLRRHGIEAYCQLNDVHTDHASLRENVRQLLIRIQPKLVGVSMKWFPHMARGLEICRLVKEFSPETQIVLGGDTATYFAQDLIQYDVVDYIVLGDGEIPLLKICQQAEQIPNCLYKKDGRVIANPISYLHQEETLAEVYLSHLDEIFVSPADLALTPYLFIFTGRGCPMNCQYCGGAREVQVGAFKRPRPYSALRTVREARNDMIRLKEHTATFLFDFDTPNFDSLATYKALWEGIDLKSHIGYFYFWYLPTAEFIELVANTFKFVSLNIDLNSLSERHRKMLTRKRFGKPQPSDEEIFSFFASCEKYDNVETAINLINGLPYFEEEDIVRSEQMLERIMQNHPSFLGLGWGRLHAQPGAPMVNHYEQFNMRPSARTFADFLHYSQLNLKEKQYPDLASLHYPLIYYTDDRLNAQVTKHYAEMSGRLREYREKKRQKLRYSRETVTYRQLNQQANQLARWLQKAGLQRGQRVGIYLERSPEMVAAALAVFKAGGAYVPLDPSYPQDRLLFMAEDARLALLITESRLAQTFDDSPFPLICLDTAWEIIAQEGDENLDAAVTSQDLAYVLYTSGSTGRPKGVMIQHQGVANLAQAQGQAFQIIPGSRVLQFAPFSFDASVSEIFVTLLAGATLSMGSANLLMPGPELVAFLQREQPNVMTCPPSVLAALPDEPFPSLQTVVSAGEPCSPAIVQRWAANRRFINAYGPTENTVCATLAECAEREQRPSIGRAIANTTVYLLDDQLQPVPLGVTGEIYVAGAGLARGYFNRAALTAERFIPNPFSQQPGTRLYRTGDLARYLPDGRLDFLGRADDQVKIRGSRVEIGEVETILGQHPAVRTCAVSAWEFSGEKRLIAYVIFNHKGAVTTSELRSFLAAKAPEYMIPYAFVTLEELPLLPNGKVNRRALPEPDRSRPLLADAYVPPRDATEELVTEIWTNSLSIGRLGVFDNFFELGGHSLLITRVLAQISEVFQVELPARVFLESPTVAGVATALTKHEATPGQVRAVAELNKKLNQLSAEELRTMLREKKQARRVTFNGF